MNTPLTFYPMYREIADMYNEALMGLVRKLIEIMLKALRLEPDAVRKPCVDFN